MIKNIVINAIKNNITTNNISIDSILEKNMANIRQSCNINAATDIYAIYDTTVFKTGKDGMVFCSNGIYWHEMFSKHSENIAYEDLYKFVVQYKLQCFSLQNYEEQKNFKGNIGDLNEIVRAVNEIKNELYLNNTSFKENVDSYINKQQHFIIEKLKKCDFEESLVLINLAYNLSCNNQLHLYQIMKLEKDANLINNSYDRALEILDKIDDLFPNHRNDTLNQIEIVKAEKIKYLNNKHEVLASQAQELIKIKKYNDALCIIEEMVEIKDSFSNNLLYIKTLMQSGQSLSSENSLKELKLLILIGKYDCEGTNEMLVNQLETFENELLLEQEKLSTIIIQKIKSGDIEFFNSNTNFINFNDKFHNSPLIYAILLNKMEFLDIFTTLENLGQTNIFGHTYASVTTIHEDKELFISIMSAIDVDFKKKIGQYKFNKNMNKAGEMVFGFIENANNKCADNVNASWEQTERSIDNSIKSQMQKNRFIENGDIEYEKLLKYFNSEYINQRKDFCNKLILSLSNKDKRKEEFKISNVELQNKIRNSNLDLGHLEDMKEELIKSFTDDKVLQIVGEKGEFEKTETYTERKRQILHDRKQQLLDEAITYAEKKMSEYIAENKVKKKHTYSQMELNKTNIINENNISAAVALYYQFDLHNIYLDKYDADKEKFSCIINGITCEITVNIEIAQDFKNKFNNLSKTIEVLSIAIFDKTLLLKQKLEIQYLSNKYFVEISNTIALR